MKEENTTYGEYRAMCNQIKNSSKYCYNGCIIGKGRERKETQAMLVQECEELEQSQVS
jgi:hypothetical protein